VPFDGGVLPAFRFPVDELRGTIAAFGGFYSYVERLFPILLGLCDLLLAGTEDNYVPLAQLSDQARLLTAARSITRRLFTRAENAQAHCQVRNLPLPIAVMTAWLEMPRAA
jgi:hypothetical protein